MKEKQYLGRVQRTLVLASGELPVRCGTLLAEKLTQRAGPSEATAIVSLGDSKETVETAVAAALTRISPPDLAARLAQTGWQLDQTTTLRLILLQPIEPGGGERAAALEQAVSSQIYHRLGIEAFIFPLWLVGEGSETWQADCLGYPQPLPLGNMVLGMCNQDGLRLPDEESLCEVASELLWCLITTPLLSMIEQHQTNSPQTDKTSLLTAGVHVWTWSPEQTMTAFTRRWLLDVLQQWLAEQVDEDSLVDVPGWLQTQQFTPIQFAAYALREREAALPQLPLADWQAPWPWEIPTLYEKTRFENGIDEEATKAYGKQAQLRLFEPLQRAQAALHESAYQRLNKQPVSGIAQATAWVKAVIAACEDLLDSVFDWENALNETAEALAVERGELETSIQDHLARYPNNHQSWPPLLWRPWRWPRLLLTYWRLQKRGQQLCQLLEKQAALRRQRIQQQTAYQGIIELIQTVRHLGSQVDEIREMLQHLVRSLTTEVQESAEASETGIPITRLPVPGALYERLVEDKAAEAIAAAAAVGGLGSQIRHLDDVILDSLHKFSQSRLAAFDQLTPADLLLAQLAADASADLSPLQQGWDAACPLWPVDAASLDETGRLNQETLTVFCGAETMLLSDKLAGLEEMVFTLPTGWRRDLWLIRLHLGLESAAGTAVATEDIKSYE